MNLPEKIESGGPPTRKQAEEIARSKLLPAHFGDPASIQYVMQIGYELGISPVTALSWVHVFPDGTGKLRATFSGHLIQALAHIAGHRIAVKSLPQVATAKLLRREMINGEVEKERIEAMKELGIDPKEFYVFEDTWNEDRAKKAGLANKDNWQKNKQSMLVVRAKVGVVRMGAPEVLMGASEVLRKMGAEFDDNIDNIVALNSGMYTPEELGHTIDEEGNPVGGESLPLKKNPVKKTLTTEQKIAEKIKDYTADQVLDLTRKILSASSIEGDEKMRRFTTIRNVVSAQERAESPVIIDGESVPLLKALDAEAQSVPAS